MTSIQFLPKPVTTSPGFQPRSGKGVEKPPKRHPVICYTDLVSPEDLRIYMQADMDGCVSYPVNRASLLNTIRAAIPHHLALLATPEPLPDPFAPQVFKVGNLGLLEGAKDSATIAFNTLPVKVCHNFNANLYPKPVKTSTLTCTPNLSQTPDLTDTVAAR